MSAFIVSNNHIAVLVRYAAFHDVCVYLGPVEEPLQVRGNESETGQILLNENYRSVNFRYKERKDVPEYVFPRIHESLRSPVEILAACDCYDYQACETPDYHDSVAAKIIQTIRKSAIRCLDGYEDAAWEIR
jgi:hypothetical protein